MAKRDVIGFVSRSRPVNSMRRRLRPWWQESILRPIALASLVRRTENFRHVRWLGQPVWQNPLDAWSIQEAITERDVELVIEAGTNRGGSSYFIGTVFDLLGRGSVITVDIEDLVRIRHPRVTYLSGSSTSPDVIDRIRIEVGALQPARTLVILDSDHAGTHVLDELRLYAEFVGLGDHVLVQDGSADELFMFRSSRPGPLWAIERFLDERDDFEIDHDRTLKFLYCHSPSGWLRRVRSS